MKDNLRKRQRVFREQEIAAAAARLLATSDCGSLTMDQIAAELGTSRASIYRIYTRQELLRRAVSEALHQTLAQAREAAERSPRSKQLQAAARLLVERWLGLASPRAKAAAPCCLREVVCPYTDWVEADGLLRQLAPRRRLGTLPLDDVGLAYALRALSAVFMHQIRAEKRRPTPADADAMLRYLFPTGRGPSPTRRSRR